MNFLFGNLTHFEALLFFALVVSLTFAFLSKRGTSRAREIHPVGVSRFPARRNRNRLADVPILAVA